MKCTNTKLIAVLVHWRQVVDVQYHLRKKHGRRIILKPEWHVENDGEHTVAGQHLWTAVLSATAASYCTRHPLHLI